MSWYFAALRVQPVVGRGFLPHEEQKGERVVIRADDLWKEQFGGDPAIAGKTIPIDRQLHTVVGVAPAGFNFPIRGRKVQIWTTLARDAASATVQPVTEQRGARTPGLIARLKPTVSLAAAQAQMDTIAGSIAKQYNNSSIASTYVRPELDRLVGDLRGPLSIFVRSRGPCSIDRLRQYCQPASGPDRGGTGESLRFEWRSGRVEEGSSVNCSPRICFSHSSPVPLEPSSRRWRSIWRCPS